MGQTGSFTAKVNMRPTMLPYTKWGATQLQSVMLRSKHELADTFALRTQEFVFLLGRQDIDVAGALDVFKNVFDTDSNKLVDKLEVLCILCLASTLSSELKVELLYDIFDFDNKGYLSEVELLLLFKIVTGASSKVDKSIALPSSEGLTLLLQSAYQFSERGTESLRKYEIVSFASNSPEVRNYMEVWRGHASQVFVVNGQKWQDVTFPATHTSIAPSKEWLSMGLPPASFVTWLRRNRLKPSCETLFGHSEKYAKAVNKMVLDGYGAMANGTMIEGLLASAWIVNAVSMLIHRPKVLMSLFPTTAQEFLGRFCIRVYEGGRWNSVFIDDRIPCSADGVPIFTRTSFSQECWMLLLEKGIAKHMGSYGQLTVAGKRADATEGMLRMLTGGHVTKIYVPDYDWESIVDEVKGEDGMAMVTKLLSEGSLISFGRSEPLVLNRETLSRFPSAALPHGRLFSVVGIEEISRHKYLVLRDPWGLQTVRSEADGEADFGSCHCRTFLLKAEDILSKFDTAFLVRFPDSLRSLDAAAYPPWTTRVRWGVCTGREAPAIFKLTVGRLDDKEDEEEEVEEAPDEAIAALVIEEDIDDDEEKVEGLEAGEAAALNKKKKVVHKPVETCISLNSSVEWNAAVPSGNEADLPSIIIKIYPTPRTQEDLARRGRDIVSVNKALYANDFNMKKRIKKEKPVPAARGIVATASSVLDSAGEATPAAATEEEAAATAGAAADGAAPTGDTVLPDAETETEAVAAADIAAAAAAADVAATAAAAAAAAAEQQPVDMFELIVRARRSWKSMSVFLWPGEYYIVSSVEYAPGVKVGSSVEDKLKDSFVKRKEKTLWSIPNEHDHRMWAQATCHESIKLLPLGPETGANPAEVKGIVTDYLETVERISSEVNKHCDREMWPFFVEHQLDTGTIGVAQILYRLRRETGLAMTELYSLRVKHEQEFSKINNTGKDARRPSESTSSQQDSNR
jgi:hypothetical protein